MSLSLRIALIVISALTMIFVLRKIRKSQMKIDDAVFWIIASFFFVIVSIFPIIIDFASDLFNIISPVNFLFLCVIFVLLLKVFFQSVKMSQIENKLQTLIQTYAIEHRKKFDDDKDDE